MFIGVSVVRRRVTAPTKEAFPVKRISLKQSRKNSARRNRKVAARHALAGHWRAQPAPMFTSGKMHYEIGANTDVMSYGGIGAGHRLGEKPGLGEGDDER